MASDYSLNLKAQLDITDIQSKLSQLQTQMGQFKNNVIGGGNKANQFQQGNANNNNISTALRTLQTSIDRLNTAINKLANQTQLANKNSTNVIRQTQSTPVSVGGAGIAMSPYSNAALITNQRMSIAVKQFQEEAKAVRALYQGGGINAAGFTRMMGGLRGSLNTSTANIQNDMANLYANDLANQPPQTREQIQNAKFLRGAKFLMGGQMLGQAGEALYNAGYTTTGNVINSMSQGMNAGAMGAMALGGPAGIAIGVGTSIATFSEMLVKEAEAAAAALRAFCASVDASTKVIKDFVYNTGFSNWSENINTKSYEDLMGTRAEKEQKLKSAKDARSLLAASVEQEKNAAQIEYLNGLNEAGDDDDKRRVVEQKYDMALKSITNKMNAANENVQKAQSEYDVVSNAVKNYDSLKGSNRSKIISATEFSEGLVEVDFNRALGKAMKEKDKENLLAAKETLTADIAKARYVMQPVNEEGKLEQFEENTGLLREQLLKASTDEERDRLKKQIEERDETAANFRKNARIEFESQGKIDSIDELLKKIDINEKKKGITTEIENLQEKLQNMKAPNMENVSSLASQGFMISAKDDDIRAKSQEHYLNEQTRLQREIKNLVAKLDNTPEFQ